MAWQNDPNVYTPNDPSGYGGTWTAYPGSVGAVGGQITQYVWSRDPRGYTNGYWALVNSAPSAPATPAAVATSTGVNPTETSYSLYGHVIPLSVFGVGRIGGDIISGPFIENGLATFCISFGVPADPYGTRILREIAFDSEVVWENGSFNVEPFTFRFYPGRLDQAVDPIETAHWGAEGVAYRPQILLWFDKLPLSFTKFKKIPYVAALLGDSSGDDVNLGEAFERLAYSPWVGYTSAEFDTIGITDGLPSGGLIFAQDAEFLATIQQFGRFYSNWNILQTDKLRIVDRGAATAADISLSRANLMGTLVFARGPQASLPRVLELSTIDPEADYTVVPSRAVRPRDPVNVTTSVSTESVYLPMIMDSSTRMSLVTYTLYQEDVARKRVNGKAMLYGFEIEPGDLLGITGLGSDFEATAFKITETTHGADYTVEFSAEGILTCALPAGPDPYWSHVVLLMGYEPGIGLLDESPHLHGLAGDYGNSDAIDATQSKFGSQSLRRALLYGPDLDWDLSDANADEFTVECWARLGAVPTEVEVLCGMSFIGIGWFFGVNPYDTFNGLRFSFQAVTDGVGGGGHPFIDVRANVGTESIVTNRWYHFAVDKDSSGKIRLYQDGVMTGSATPLDSNIDSTSWYMSFDIGQTGLFGTNKFVGNIDEIRITKGVARYKSDGGFPIPTSSWPRRGT